MRQPEGSTSSGSATWQLRHPRRPRATFTGLGVRGAGRKGQAILFVAKRERRLLKMIEKTTRQPIERMSVPSGAQIGEKRIGELKALIEQTIQDNELGFYEALVERHVDELWSQGETGASARAIAAAMIYLHQQQRPLIVAERPLEDLERGEQKGAARLHSSEAVRYRMDVGSSHGLEVKHVVGCIANEAGIPSRQIGKIRIQDEYSTVELPSDLSPDLIEHLARAWTCGRQLKMTPLDAPPEPKRSARAQAQTERPSRHRKGGKPKRAPGARAASGAPGKAAQTQAQRQDRRTRQAQAQRGGESRTEAMRFAARRCRPKKK